MCLASGDMDGNLLLWSIAEGRIMHELHGHEKGLAITTLSFSPDGAVLASATAGASLRLWETRTGTFLPTPKYIDARAVGALTRNTVALSWIGSGTILAIGNGTKVTLWDARLRAEKGGFHVHDQGIDAMSVSPDGQTVATSNHVDRHVHL